MTEETQALLERLRGFAFTDDGLSNYVADGELVTEAADRIEALTSALSAVERERDRKTVEIAVLREALGMAQARVCTCPPPLPPGCYGSAALPAEQER